MENYNPVQQTASEAEGKTAGIVSYLTIIGWLVAYFAMHKDKKTDIGSYQLRQTLLLHISSFVIGIILNILYYSMAIGAMFYVSGLVNLAFFILWLIGLIGAINGQKKPIPLIGEKAQTTFPSI
ncbi:DUF4870 domain-containing protein [Taibaiella helva]|uniref:DUF4870 domain-containing protein n=1 Tax=Taibaiella helva TaxID=2301235 RepID=UPI000E5869CB|nr:hypothetical protein [Taibaiella helva]